MGKEGGVEHARDCPRLRRHDRLIRIEFPGGGPLSGTDGLRANGAAADSSATTGERIMRKQMHRGGTFALLAMVGALVGCGGGGGGGGGSAMMDDAVPSPVNAAMLREWTDRTTSLTEAARVADIERDGAGGFNVTYEVNGESQEVALSAATYVESSESFDHAGNPGYSLWDKSGPRSRTTRYDLRPPQHQRVGRVCAPERRERLCSVARNATCRPCGVSRVCRLGGGHGDAPDGFGFVRGPLRDRRIHEGQSE